MIVDRCTSILSPNHRAGDGPSRHDVPRTWKIGGYLIPNVFIAAPHAMRQAAPLQSTMPLIPDESNIASHHNGPPQPDRVPVRNPQPSAVHSRETSAARGRTGDTPVSGLSTLQPQQRHRGQSQSKSPEPTATRPGAGYEGTIERRPSNSYGHHRQTSIVHGIQHSRNPSFAASSTTSSPLSPEIIASFGRSGSSESDSTLAGRLEQPDQQTNYTSPGSNGTSHVQPPGLSTIEDNDTDEPSAAQPRNPTHRKMVSNGRPRREQSHARGHSKHHHHPPESKTVGEYALHHLFNSVKYPSLIEFRRLSLIRV